MQRKRQSDSTHAEVLSSGFPLRPPTGLPYFHFTLNSLKSVIFCNVNNPPHVCLCLSPPKKGTQMGVSYSEGCALVAVQNHFIVALSSKLSPSLHHRKSPEKKKVSGESGVFFKRQQQMYRIRKYVFPSDIR